MLNLMLDNDFMIKNVFLKERIKDISLSGFKELESEINKKVSFRSGFEYIYIDFRLSEDDGMYKLVMHVESKLNVFKDICEFDICVKKDKEIIKELEEVEKRLKEIELEMASKLENIENVLGKIKLINENIQREAIDKGLGVSNVIRYYWGNEECCVIKNWDFIKIRILLSKKAVKELENITEEELLSLINDNYYRNMYSKIITEFRKCELHKRIGANLLTLEPVKELVRNLLSNEDVIRVIRFRYINDAKGRQEFKSVSVVNGLGVFIALTDWVVNYDKKMIEKLDVIQVYDIEEDRFVGGDIYRRIRNKVIIDKEKIKQVFIKNI